MSELRRRAVHASGALLPALYLSGLVTYRRLQVLFVAGSAAVVVLEALRLGLDAVPWPLTRLFDELVREYERSNPAGYALYAFSSTAVVLVFPPFAAVAGVLMLMLGDPVSGVLGSAGPGEHKRPSVMAVMFVVCAALALAALALVEPPVADPVAWVVAASAGALGATLADGFKPVVAGYVLDDNATIPPAGALGVFVVFWLA